MGRGLRPSARATLRLIGELTHIYAYHCPQYMRPKFQLSILIYKKMGQKQGPLRGPWGKGDSPHICVSLFSILYEQ